MKQLKLFTLALFLNFGINNLFSQGTWTQKASFGGSIRSTAVGFSISGKGYIGIGRGNGLNFRNDFWEYDPIADTWTQKANFGGSARQYTVGFSIGAKGYVGTGWSSGNVYHKDFWEYDPNTNSWTQMADVGGTTRIRAVGFSIGNKGYIGTGYEGNSVYKNDFWEYDPNSDTWTQKANFGGTARYHAVGLSINGKGYIGTGRDGAKKDDFWEYDPNSDTWTQKANFGGTPRSGALGFAIDNKGYIGAGSDAGGNKVDLWQFNPDSNIWTQKANFSGSSRVGAVDFSIGNKGYFGTGHLFGSSSSSSDYLNDFWEYATIVPPVNWIGFYNQLSNNPEPKLSDIDTLVEKFSDDPQLTPVKICADGSTVTIVRFENKTGTANSDIRFVPSSYAGNVDSSGEFLSTYSYNGDTITASFTHPTFMNLNALFRSDGIQVKDNITSTVLFEYPIEVHRAPVVMVHGLWGNATSFSEMRNDLINTGHYNSTLLYIIDYSDSNSVSFAENANVIKEGINRTFKKTRDSNYSAGKVDLIAHSMGGVLSRIYLQNEICSQSLSTNCYREDIHKLITLNTPHSGSHAANLISNPIGSAIKLILENVKKYYSDRGAIEDLRVDGSAIQSLNNSPNLNRNIVPSHVITTGDLMMNDLDCFSLGVMLNGYANYTFGTTGAAFLASLFEFDGHDLVVSKSSQQGGLSSYTNFISQCHLEVPSNSFVFNKVLSLLDDSPNNSNSFSVGGFQPPELTSIYKVSPFVEGFGEGSGDVTITSPTNGTNFYTNDIVPISVSGSSNIVKILYGAGNEDLNITAQDTAASSATFNYSVPSEAIGEIRIIALGYDTAGYIDYDTISLNINTLATLDSITLYGDKIYLPNGQQQSVPVIGYYDDGVIRNLSNVSTVQFQLANTSIAQYINGNNIKGVQVGNTSLTVTYQSKSVQIEVEVYQADNWVSIKDNSDQSNLNSQSIINLKVYPNPFNNATTIEYELSERANVQLEIFDMIGQMVEGVINENQSNGKYSYQITLSEFPSGIYFYKFRANSTIKSGKIIFLNN